VKRPRPWMPIDRAFLVRGSIETLGEHHGPAGPVVIFALIAEACAPIGGGKREDFDLVAWRYPFLARRAFTTATEARAIVDEARDLGLVELLEDDGEAFRLRLLRFREWHGNDPGAAERQAASRARR
jgi:hypothetical protein